MSAEQLTALINAARDDASVAERFAEATTPEQGVAIAAELGFHLTTEDLEQDAGATRATGELSEQELTPVAGGNAALSWGVIYCGGGPPGSWGVISCSG
ncbi:MAG: Nif11 domain [Actinomycetota bacterium]|nr:Nif11 domain [Actinomycetota bacterium]